jgi:site-specific DNA-methyltransferase (adenine-specific)
MKLINADCIAAMKEMEDNSVDSIVTDPPYELGFMGKSWDASGIAFNIEVWQQALRVLKPGGHLIAFSGSRTYHRMAVAIEDAGFQIRDQIMWVYGSGFPKSHNISKGIDKALDFEGEVIGTEKIDIGIQGGSMHAGRQTNVVEREVVELSLDAAKWQGWGTALKPAHEPMVLARKPVVGTIANNVLTYGVGGLNIDGTRVGTDLMVGESAKSAGEVMKTELKADYKSPDHIGRFPANFIHDGSDEVLALFPYSKSGAMSGEYNSTIMAQSNGNRDGKTIKLTQQASEGSAARFFYCAKASKRDRNEGLDGFEAQQVFGDEGGTYQGLSNSKHPDKNHHPTVKPTSLMQYLIRLVTPPNGIVLDPFMGSGSTGKACAYEGFDFIGIEQSSEYVEIAKARIEYARGDKE